MQICISLKIATCFLKVEHITVYVEIIGQHITLRKTQKHLIQSSHNYWFIQLTQLALEPINRKHQSRPLQLRH